MERWLSRLSRWFALAGAGVALLVAAMAVWSIAGRYLLSRPLMGDVEITQMGIALSISLCLPWCQWRRAHIIVDFFTQRMGPGVQRTLDALGCMLMAVMGLLLAWRTLIGAFSVADAFEQTMILGLPMWWAYAGLAPGLLLSAVVALWQAKRLTAGQATGADQALEEPA
ncbi:MAG: TRAP transporter small permease [Burkholderiaceae bacterium]|jgi:TRAP-type C4-dicarboxylate transport system permease small subunit